ncbi:hypothetical protein BGZ57DRAFT_914244 [Hyaloscypha finlandica]|nr:hypothetical protein BGZ57DRAFT_914244 [Hyaloscypha finlandica]
MGRGFIASDDLANKRESNYTHAPVFPDGLWMNFTNFTTLFPGRCLRWALHRSVRTVYLGCTLWVLAVTIYLSVRQTTSFRITSVMWQNRQQGFDAQSSSASPFTGAFARFPRVSELPARHKRMTIVTVWNDDAFPSYLRHFFYTIQLNAEHLDLLVINRLGKNGTRCLDFEKAGVNITWGGNIKVHCMTDEGWQNRHVDFLCSTESGWNCDPVEREEVMKEFQDEQYQTWYNWRPVRGFIFRDLFQNPSNPLWGWMDHDVFVGNFAHYPFNILSQVSMASGSMVDPYTAFFAGQLTAFNMDDTALRTAWKKFPALKSAAHFTKYLEGKMPDSSEERYWSYGYFRSDEDLPGADLSWCLYPGMNGDDYYDEKWNRKNSNLTYLISGREVLLASTSYTRKEIEDLIKLERQTPIDDIGGIGWTGGEDGSAYLVAQPSLSSSEAKRLAMSKDGPLSSPRVHEGIVEDLLLSINCTGRPRWKQCVDPHPLTESHPPIMRSSLIHFKEQEKNHVIRRLERDQRQRGYERKLLRHHLKSKNLPWFELPSFDITEDLVLRYNSDMVEVFKMGISREENLFYRKEGEESIG